MECWIIAAMQCLGLELNLQGEAVCSRTKGHGERVLHTFTTPNLSVPHTQSTLTARGFLSLFQSPQAASPFIFLNSLPFSGSHLLCLSRKCLLLCLNLKKKNPQHFLPVLLESRAHPGLLLTVSCIFVSIAVTVCREKMGRCKISLQSKKWMSLQTILYSNPNWLLKFQLNFNFPWWLIFKINLQGVFFHWYYPASCCSCCQDVPSSHTGWMWEVSTSADWLQ